tara:strand:+ start:67 stop:531 length:465 start_codon:yes stop_codon:yes gene_type:complete
MSNWENPSWKMRVGVNHAPAYQVSGRPFASGGIDASVDQQVVNFPYVTRWVEVLNAGSGTVKVGFGPFCFSDNNKNFFTVPSGSTTGRLEVKVNRIYVKGGDQNERVAGGSAISVVAGLTSIDPDKVNFPTGSRDQWHLDSTSISWSGSYNGVG